MHAQAIDGSRQMQQTVMRQYVCMVHSFREEGQFIKYIGNIRRGGGQRKGSIHKWRRHVFSIFWHPSPPCWQFFASVRQQISKLPTSFMEGPKELKDWQYWGGVVKVLGKSVDVFYGCSQTGKKTYGGASLQARSVILFCSDNCHIAIKG